jgi:AcrR family transcriptional regulator
LADLSTPTARGPYRNGIKRRRQIVESAANVFAEFGYSGGSIRTIAARVGISPATLIQHFGSKEGLLEAVLEDWTMTAVPIPDDVNGLAYFEAMRGLMDFHIEHRGLIELFLTMTAEASSSVHPARDFIQRRYAHTFGEFAKHLREARDAGEIQLAEDDIAYEVRMMMAAMDGLELQWLIDPSVDLAGLYNRCVDESIRRWKTPSGR